MRRWARLTWQSADPAAVAADLGRWLGTPSIAGLELVPWRREAPSDDPTSAGRLVFEPIEGGEPDPVLVEWPPVRLAGVGWATVELDRAEGELDAWLEGTRPDPDDDGLEPHLGARVRVRDADGLPGDVLVLEEPTTEGRLAASLARDGEGPCALYLVPSGGLDAWLGPARARGVAMSAIHDGPFGRSVLLPPAAAGGPFVIVVEHPQPSSGVVPPGTIEA